MLNLTIRQLRAVLAIHDKGKITNAAKELGLTAPAVTLQLKQVEDELRMTLFDRTPNGLRPTAAGIAAIEAARAVVERLRLLSDEVSAINGLRAGTLKLGAVSTAKYFAPRMIAAFLKQHPGVKVDLFVGNRAETIAALSKHELDIALMGRPPRDVPVRAAIFGDHPLVIIAPPDHPLARRIDIPKEEVARENFLVREPGSGTRISLDVYFAGVAGWAARPGTEMGSNETIKQAVMAGLGVALISAHTIAAELEDGRVAVLDVEGLPIRRQWRAVRLASREPSPAMSSLWDFIASQGGALLPAEPAAPGSPGPRRPVGSRR